MSLALDTAVSRADFVEKALNPGHVATIGKLVAHTAKTGNDLFPKYWSPEQVVTDMVGTARKAELFTGTKEMLKLVMDAAKTHPPQTLELYDLPADDGWLYLPHPFTTKTEDGEDLPVIAIMWSRRELGQEGRKPAVGMPAEGEGVLINLFYSLAGDEPLMASMDAHEQELVRRQYPMAGMIGAVSVAFGANAWATGTGQGIGAANAAMQSVHDFTFDHVDDDGWFVGTTMRGAEVRVKPDPVVQFLKSYWHFCDSEVASMEEEPLPRQYRRAMERKGLPTGPVTTVILRKEKNGLTGEGGGWELQYKYIRRRHKRKQWYGPKDARYSRYIWIEAHQVGPDDKPWRDGPVVNVLAR